MTHNNRYLKRAISLVFILTVFNLVAGAQVTTRSVVDPATLMFTLNAASVLLAMYVASSFLLALVRIFLNDRLNKHLIEKGASPEMAALMLSRQEGLKENALKWCCLLASAGIGLTACYFSLPAGLHSVIFLTFSLALGFLVFYLLTRREK